VARRVGEAAATVSFKPFPYRCEYEAAAAIWARWASPPPLRMGEWLEWPASVQEDWLHVVQNSWFALNRPPARLDTGTIAQLDGEQMPTLSAFYIALGEAFNGPGGYVGSNRDALAECLTSDSGEGPPARVIWRNFDASERLLGRSFLDSIRELAGGLGVDLSVRSSAD
jgi:RNAse (barnase) inhibitor barstar